MHTKNSEGLYKIGGDKFEVLSGSRRQVWNKTAYKTNGGLTRRNLVLNKRGRIVSKKMRNTAKRSNRLEKAGYFTKKGHFGFIRK